MMNKKRTPNWRFGVMAAVALQKGQCKFEPLYPAGSSVEAAAAPSRSDVVRKRGVTVQSDSGQQNEKLNVK